MSPSCSHGTEKAIPSMPASARMLFTALYDRRRPSPSPMMEAEHRNEGRLQQEAERDHSPLVTDRPHHPNMLAPLHHGARAHHAQRRHSDEEPQGHEAREQPEERLPGRILLIDALPEHLRLHPVLQQGGLQRH